MPYTVLVSKTFQKRFQKLPSSLKNKIKGTLKELQKDPHTSRPKCDIKILRDTHPQKHRLRIGSYRIIYFINKDKVKIIDLIKREIGYSKIE